MVLKHPWIKHFERESYAGAQRESNSQWKVRKMMMALLSKRESEASTAAPDELWGANRNTAMTATVWTDGSR